MAKKVFLSGSLALTVTTGEGSTLTTYGLTSINISETTDLKNTTDLSGEDYVAGEFVGESDGATKFNFSADLWRDFAKAVPKTNQKYEVTLTIETDIFSGVLIIGSITENGTYDTAIRYSMSGSFTGRLNEKPT